jgi:F0F1-type ATP synthase assembly protein I
VELSQRSEPSNNYGDGMSIAFELVGTPAIFGVMGFGLDRWLGTTPLFTIGLTLIALATVAGLTIWRYNAEMARADSARRTARHGRAPRTARWDRGPVSTSDLSAGEAAS